MDGGAWRATQSMESQRIRHELATNKCIIKTLLKDIAIISRYIPDNPKLVNQKLTELKGKRINSVITVGDFHTTLSIMDSRTRQKIIKLVRLE